jgi:hypothetical protein
MTADKVREIARAVLYEGYLLWPYRRSARKNQQRWCFGGLFPQRYAETSGAGDAWLTRTECLIEADGSATLDVTLRFLHLVAATGGAEEAVVAAEEAVAEEAVEREAVVSGRRLGDLAVTAHRLGIDHPALSGWVEVAAARVSPAHFKLTVTAGNTTAWSGGSRAEALRHAFISAHTVLKADGGSFVSLIDPPPELRPLAANCRGVGAWPVLVGNEGDRSHMLSAPIILYDYPRIAPESPGDLFDATEIDQLLTLSILSLTEEEQREIRAGDPRGRDILDRCATLSPEQLMRLNGTLREVRP